MADKKTTYQREKAKNLEAQLRSTVRKIDKIINITATATETSNIFWKKLETELNQAYEDLRIITKKWVNSDMPIVYREVMRDEISKIKNKKTFKPDKNVLFTKASNTDFSKQSMAAIMNETLTAFDTGFDSGKKSLIRLLRTTQQLNLEEKRIHNAIESGYIESGSINASIKKLRNELLKKAIDGKYITVVDKNGKPRQYQVKSYAELVARTKLQELSSISVMNTASAFESDLVQVSSHNTKTQICIPFEGKIFSISGDNKDFPKLSEVPPFHPNCLHSLSVTFEEALEIDGTYQEYSDFSKGKTEKHPTRRSHEPVSQRKGLK